MLYTIEHVLLSAVPPPHIPLSLFMCNLIQSYPFHTVASYSIPFIPSYGTSLHLILIHAIPPTPNHVLHVLPPFLPIPPHAHAQSQSQLHTREKRSSDVIARSPPGQSRGVGRPPTATTKRLEVRTWTLPWNQKGCSGVRNIGSRR